MRMPRTLTGCLSSLLAIGMLDACAVHHVTPYVPDTNALPTADAADAGSGCFEAETALEHALCASPALEANRAMLRALQADLRQAGLFGRDAILASQREWLLALPGTCHLDDPREACLAGALQAREASLRAWEGAAAPRTASAAWAISQYVVLRPAAGAVSQPEPALCADLAHRAGEALGRTGGLDPASMGGAEVAGSHGPAAAADPGHRISVDLYDANAYALFQRRARSLSLDGAPPAITPISLTQLAEAQSSANRGGRFSAFASQTGDYGSIDAFRLGRRLLALVADPWGSTAPAAPGEAAHAGVWDIAGAAPVPACLFDIYTRPSEPGVFDQLPAFSAWRALLAELRQSATPAIGSAFARDQGQLAADTAFSVLHMPLVGVQLARDGGWTPWLRRRHDAVLDALFAWSQSDPGHKPLFDRLFQALRPAATDLVGAYQTTQGLSGPEATEAAGLAIMELLYEATATIAPGLGADLDAPRSAALARPRYMILAAPQ